MNCKEKQRREEYYMTSLEEGIEEKDIVRVIDEIINKLDLKKLGYKEKERKNNAGCSMAHMFYACYKLESIDLRNADLSKITSVYFLFKSANSVKEINLSKQ